MSLQPRKYGAFSGVFTPSILTILGVIMYMRLGWVVGQSGLIITIGIILLAHVISVSTGLSISSIATDKKIKVGGIYYMLSRSLGLPIGGSIGITIFIGTAFSIALYIIGFCENFLGIETISRLTGLEPSIESYRIVGTLILTFLAIIAFISTSIAIKAQFFILGAIALSLVSVFLGFYLMDPAEMEPVSLLPAESGVSMITVFAIFFPAVTGFTAGVAMSGDLKNPKSNIPAGTLIAILVGLLVYLALATGIAFFVNREILLSDMNYLMRMAWFSPLVIAGIWGATLSSALGGILGAPRILQAISKDRITPKVFGKGFGVNNEPRTALLLTFVIAEMGIMIGELDVVASIVTMFYIAAYGFINLAFALEKWASTDFRPSFKISMWIGIIGFIACFAVMFKLDTVAMIVAMLVLAAIYYYIKRKKLALDYGDVWQSVWSAIIRSILKRIETRGLEERNWRPNIILFSGGSGNRPHLLQLGKDLAGKRGLLSNFDLVLNKSAKVLLKKHQQVVENDEKALDEGFFTRKHECKDVYEGIEVISSTYGFSGVEPNTVLMGWGRQTQDPDRFVRMIKTLSDLDLNILMVDYDKDLSFGKKQVIDIWCRGGGNNCTLMLSLIKFLWLSEDWKNAQARILIINPINDEKEKLIKDAEKVLEKLRMDAEIKVMNNQIEQRPVHEIIQVESSNSDLVFLGIPEVQEGQEQLYVDNINYLCQNIGTVVLMKASSYFKEIEIGNIKSTFIQEKSEFIKKGIDAVNNREIKIPEITYPKHPVLAEHLRNLYEKLKGLNKSLYNSYLEELFSYHHHPIHEIKEATEDNLKKFNGKLLDKNQSDLQELAFNIQSEIIAGQSKIINQLDESSFRDQRNLLQKGIQHYNRQLDEITKPLPELITIELTRNELKLLKEDRGKDTLFKGWRKFLIKVLGIKKRYHVKYSRMVEAHLDGALQYALYEVFQNWGMISIQYIIKIQKLNEAAIESHIKIDKLIRDKGLSDDIVQDEINKMNKLYQAYKRLNEAALQSLYLLLLNKVSFIVQQISNDLNTVNPNRLIARRKKANLQFTKIPETITKIPGLWYDNMKILNKLNELQLINYKLILELRTDLFHLYNGINEKSNHLVLKHYQKLIQLFGKPETRPDVKQLKAILTHLDSKKFIFLWNDMIKVIIGELKSRPDKLVKSIDIIRHDVYENFKENQFTKRRPNSFHLRSMATQTIKEDYLKPIQLILDELSVKLGESISAVNKRVSQYIEIIESGQVAMDRGYDIERYEDEVQEFLKEEFFLSEKILMKVMNQIMERRNSLMDKFSILTILRAKGNIRKYLR